MDVLCIGSVVMDITARPIGQKNQWEEKQRISAIQIQTGGDAANQSIRLADLGLDAALAACVGQDPNGSILCSSLRARGVRTEYIVSKKECATGTALVLVDEAGERHTFSVQGAHSTIEKADLPWDALNSCRAISLASLFSMPQLEKDGLLAFLQEAKKKGILIFADLAADKLKQGLPGIAPFLPYIDYFLPSLYDALAMTGASDAQEAAKKYLDCGVKCVVIKCGSEGCYFVSGELCGTVPAVKVDPVDTTGAGDCMSALFISRILQGEGVRDACRFACSGASYSTLFLGASAEKLIERRILEWMKAAE
ncbi:MAG: carbohydrate kinase family protein [Candidatus Choladocola sp.]|nr:carbohydrate kinase family protein [Candidatus Choladocola sp.]